MLQGAKDGCQGMWVPGLGVQREKWGPSGMGAVGEEAAMGWDQGHGGAGQWQCWGGGAREERPREWGCQGWVPRGMGVPGLGSQGNGGARDGQWLGGHRGHSSFTGSLRFWADSEPSTAPTGCSWPGGHPRLVLAGSGSLPHTPLGFLPSPHFLAQPHQETPEQVTGGESQEWEKGTGGTRQCLGVCVGWGSQSMPSQNFRFLFPAAEGRGRLC